MTHILMILMIFLITGFSAALGAVDLRKLCNEQTDVHCTFLPPTVDLAYNNATVDIYAPANFLGQDRNPNGATSAWPLGCRGRAHFTCKGATKDSIFNLLFNSDGSSEVRASPDNTGKGKAAFNDAPTVHPAPGAVIRSSTAGVDVILACQGP